MTLEKLIARQNLWRKQDNKIDAANLTIADREELLNVIECLMSPENISHDGERSRAQIAKARREFESARAILNAAPAAPVANRSDYGNQGPDEWANARP